MSTPASQSDRALDDGLARLALLGVAVGLNLQRGQELVVSAPLEASALVGHVARAAYRRGARLVTCLYDDPAMLRDRLVHAEDASLDCAPDWLHRGVADALRGGAAWLHVVGPYPDLLSGIDPDRIVRAHRALALASRAEAELTAASRTSWSTLPFATASWARQVFPELPPADASRRLWDAIFEATRVSCGDPVAAWRDHNRELNARRDRLQERRLAALRFHDGYTDLTVGLAEGHRWVGGTVVTAQGVEGTCSIPSEEVLTCPHRGRTHGHVFLSRPLALAGALVAGVRLEFRAGVATSVTADRGQAILEKLISSDPGARRLGEVGLVPSSSAVARSGLLFYNALFDENAASHVAFGQSHAASVAGEGSLEPETSGANESSIHLDCMFGNDSMDVDGVARDGRVEAIMRRGEFVI